MRSAEPQVGERITAVVHYGLCVTEQTEPASMP